MALSVKDKKEERLEKVKDLLPPYWDPEPRILNNYNKLYVKLLN